MRVCPKCGNEKAYFIGKACGDCHARGLDLNVGAGHEEGAMAKSFRKAPCGKGCGREIGVNQLSRHEAACTGEPRAGKKEECPWGHEMRANVWEHKKVCKQRPKDGSEQPVKVKRRKPQKRGRGRHGQVDRDVPAGPGRAAASGHTEGPAWLELLAGRNAALAQSLVEEAIRGGMSLPMACALVGRALGR
jgi:hypothetical protein